ncbi:heavy metal translocating P-type ATPase [Treponema pectinovorum]|uniref:heavy metal translocating P-type ATPase n=1 Tax=Treponema pectinovorum TaxID=164 RepID=UPI0011F2E959|nr:heavy metal translocating P-type ATPase [Treponema pectinovorum]
MDKYEISGMSCAACVARVEKAVSKVEGVSSCTVSLLTNSMGVEGNANENEIIQAVKNAGYDAKPLNDSEKKSTSSSSLSKTEELLENKETPILVKRLIYSSVLLLALMYVSMGRTMLNFPLPSWFTKGGTNYVAIGLLQMILSAVIMLINKKFFVSGFKSLVHASPNMDSLVAMGSGVSFVYSTIMLFGMSAAVMNGDNEKILHHMKNLYFESAAMIVTLITIGKLLESVSKGRTTSALKSLMKLAPKTATVIRDGNEVEIQIEDVRKDDIFVVRPGENIPVDGIIIEGNTAINESALTGESIPVDKKEGDEVSAATTNQTGFIKCRASRVGEDTTLSQIIRMVSDAAATKAPIAKIADKVSGVFVPVVILIATITFIIWLSIGAEFSFALRHAIAVLVVSCPCALGLATPVAIMVGSGVAAKNGILFKTSSSLEQAGRTKIVALDKTGTLTKGEPVVTDIVLNENSKDSNIETFLKKAASLESKSEHPLAKAIIQKAKDEKIELKEVKDFIALPGYGLSATLEGKKIAGGNFEYISKVCSNSIENEMQKKAEELSSQGKTPLFFVENEKLLGIIAVADVLKEDSVQAVQELKGLGLNVVLLTGDNQRTALAIAKNAQIEEVIAGVLPDGKEKVIKALKDKGSVCMVGDGINDAPALTLADTGMAIGAGTDVALDAADVVLVKSQLTDVATSIRLSRKTLTNIHQNLFWAFFYNIILIPIAAGAYHHLFNLDMNPMFGAAAMSLSSFCVVMNALRLNFFRVKNTKHYKSIKNPEPKSFIIENNKDKNNTKESTMEKTLKIEGMMCQNCERHVKEALEKIDGVESATTSHEKKSAVVKLSKEVSDSQFEKAITDAGYKLVK